MYVSFSILHTYVHRFDWCHTQVAGFNCGTLICIIRTYVHHREHLDSKVLHTIHRLDRCHTQVVVFNCEIPIPIDLVRTYELMYTRYGSQPFWSEDEGTCHHLVWHLFCSWTAALVV